ncbi:MAG: hypothetical protein K0Q95_1081 [Bacteroidota bacterium]|nr:hypothetical protein [Bacteroidota bacterium]
MQTYFFKKALAVSSVLFILSRPLSAQTYSNKESSILSFTVGMTSSNLINYPVKFRSGILFNGGLVYSLMLNDKFNVGIEALYTGKGFKNESPIIKYRYFFADIPLYLQLKVGGAIRFNLGGQYSIATSGHQILLDPSKENGVRSEKVSPLRTSDYGILGGMEVDLSKQISVGARYTISGSTFFEQDNFNFGVFQFSFKYSPIRTYKVFFHKKEVQQ